MTNMGNAILQWVAKSNLWPQPWQLGHHGDHLRLDTLVRLRWLAIFGQSLVVIVVCSGLGYAMPIWPSLAVIGASFWLNLMLVAVRRNTQRMKAWESTLQLCFDVVQLAALLGLTGGLANPFCLLLMAPATVAAANLSTRSAIIVVFASLGASIALAFYALPLPWATQGGFVLPDLYRFGILAALIIGILFISAYAWLAAKERARMERALTATQNILEKEHRLSALGSLAAAAAHELGTPLGTIQVVAKEMCHNLKPDDPLYEDAALMVEQTQRCREILRNLAAKPEQSDDALRLMRLKTYFHLLKEPLKRSPKTVVCSVHLSGHTEDVAMEIVHIQRAPEWLYAFSALLENAADFAHTRVNFSLRIDDQFVIARVEDDGDGFGVDILNRLGEPYVSSRTFGDDADKASGKSYSGMGMGFFIAKTLLENANAVVTFGNRDQGGAFVQALWSRPDLDTLIVENQGNSEEFSKEYIS